MATAASWAETLKARHIFIGVNSVDYSNYPDCRKEFIESFLNTVNLGTCAADENWKWCIETPLQDLNEKRIEIIKNLLKNTDMSISDISRKLHFNNEH